MSRRAIEREIELLLLIRQEVVQMRQLDRLRSRELRRLAKRQPPKLRQLLLEALAGR